MQKKYLVVIPILALILIIFGLINNTNNKTTTPIKEKAVQLRSNLPTPKITTVKLTDKGFDPKTVKIKVGEAVTWINDSDKDASVNSADHPTHKLYTFLNLGLFSSGSSVQTQFLSKGTFQYHNHLAPSQTGTVIVE